MNINIRDYVSDDHIESISEIATGQARIIQALSLDNSQKDKEIERLNNIINELEKELDRGYMDLFEHELVPGRELITNIKNYIQELKGDSSNGNK